MLPADGAGGEEKVGGDGGKDVADGIGGPAGEAWGGRREGPALENGGDHLPHEEVAAAGRTGRGGRRKDCEGTHLLAIGRK